MNFTAWIGWHMEQRIAAAARRDWLAHEAAAPSSGVPVYDAHPRPIKSTETPS